MELDPMTIAVIVILIIIVGVFIGTQMGGGEIGNAIASSAPAQYSGGGCGR